MPPGYSLKVTSRLSCPSPRAMFRAIRLIRVPHDCSLPPLASGRIASRSSAIASSAAECSALPGSAVPGTSRKLKPTCLMDWLSKSSVQEYRFCTSDRSGDVQFSGLDFASVQPSFSFFLPLTQHDRRTCSGSPQTNRRGDRMSRGHPDATRSLVTARRLGPGFDPDRADSVVKLPACSTDRTGTTGLRSAAGCPIRPRTRARVRPLLQRGQ